MISKVIKYLSTCETIKDISELVSQLRNHFSQFYIEVARIELDMGLKTFHNYVENALGEVNYSKADPILLEQILSNNSTDIDYGDLAFIIGTYIKTTYRSFNQDGENKELARTRKTLKQN